MDQLISQEKPRVKEPVPPNYCDYACKRVTAECETVKSTPAAPFGKTLRRRHEPFLQSIPAVALLRTSFACHRALPFIADKTPERETLKDEPYLIDFPDMEPPVEPYPAYQPSSLRRDSGSSRDGSILDVVGDSDDESPPVTYQNRKNLPVLMSGSLTALYGGDCCDLLIKEMGSYPVIYNLTPNRLPGTVDGFDAEKRAAWNEVMTKLRTKFPGVPDNVALKAWRAIRQKYNTRGCPKKYVGKIPYLEKPKFPQEEIPQWWRHLPPMSSDPEHQVVGPPNPQADPMIQLHRVESNLSNQDTTSTASTEPIENMLPVEEEWQHDLFDQNDFLEPEQAVDQFYSPEEPQDYLPIETSKIPATCASKQKSGMDMFRDAHGQAAVEALVETIGTEFEFYNLSLSHFTKPAELRPSERDAWARIMERFRAKGFNVDDKEAFLAWKPIRKYYFSTSCRKGWEGAIDYLNALRPEGSGLSNSFREEESGASILQPDHEEIYEMPTESAAENDEVPRKKKRVTFDGIQDQKSDSLMLKYGQEACNLMIEEAGKHVAFYKKSLSAKSQISDLTGAELDGWNGIMNAMTECFPGISEEIVFKAWRCLRRFYSTSTCPRKYAGKIDYLNEMIERRRSGTSENATVRKRAVVHHHQPAQEVKVEETCSALSSPNSVLNSKRPAVTNTTQPRTPPVQHSSPDTETHDLGTSKRSNKSAVSFFEDKYGKETMELVIGEIGKEPDFYRCHLHGCKGREDMDKRVRDGWDKIVANVLMQCPQVDEEDIFKAWGSIRKNYYNAAGKGNRFFGKIDFLNNMAKQPRRKPTRPKSQPQADQRHMIDKRAPSPPPGGLDYVSSSTDFAQSRASSSVESLQVSRAPSSASTIRLDSPSVLVQDPNQDREMHVPIIIQNGNHSDDDAFRSIIEHAWMRIGALGDGEEDLIQFRKVITTAINNTYNEWDDM
ncbi:hypothetical protein QR680_019346 [Steinernema hermaphroditum]|uniref:MADF domain-containing protein n=1 Tax=Steinernema hermaphroditum TaxID=289476 RepID=A0AA39LAT2_9BILA|nr:hypothetical protein QR680_019346 [Steinernema hermaphroditum]